MEVYGIITQDVKKPCGFIKIHEGTVVCTTGKEIFEKICVKTVYGKMLRIKKSNFQKLEKAQRLFNKKKSSIYE